MRPGGEKRNAGDASLDRFVRQLCQNRLVWLSLLAVLARLSVLMLKRQSGMAKATVGLVRHDLVQSMAVRKEPNLIGDETWDETPVRNRVPW